MMFLVLVVLKTYFEQKPLINERGSDDYQTQYYQKQLFANIHASFQNCTTRRWIITHPLHYNSFTCSLGMV